MLILQQEIFIHNFIENETQLGLVVHKVKKKSKHLQTQQFLITCILHCTSQIIILKSVDLGDKLKSGNVLYEPLIYLFIFLSVMWKIISVPIKRSCMMNCTIKTLRICQRICIYGKSLQKERCKEVLRLPRTGTDWNCKRGNIIRLEWSRQRQEV